jgi:hypothetical protein
MLVHADERIPIARLLTFLAHGERLASTCASAQAGLVTDCRERVFLQAQARQEALHAVIFQSAIVWLAPAHFRNEPVLPALEEYQKKLFDALSRKDVIESVLAEQVILEGLGEAILTRIEAGLVKRGASWSRLRRMLLHQEEAHHAFGRRVLERAMSENRTDAVALRSVARDYLALTGRMILALSDLFESISEDPTAWANDIERFMPGWLASQDGSDRRS